MVFTQNLTETKDTIMISINASNGCGLVPFEELAEALGMFQLQKNDYIIPNGKGGTIQEFVEDVSWLFTYKGRVYRIQLVIGPSTYSIRPVPIRMHFDYLRQEST